MVEFIKSNWSWGDTMDKKLIRKTRPYFTLNFPCGRSKAGDIRADIDKEHKPDVIADLKNPPFKPGSFEVLICDPPYSMFNRFKWLLPLKDLCTKFMILSTPKLCPIFKGFKRVVWYSVANDKLFLRPWILYSKNNQIMDKFFE